MLDSTCSAAKALACSRAPSSPEGGVCVVCGGGEYVWVQAARMQGARRRGPRLHLHSARLHLHWRACCVSRLSAFTRTRKELSHHGVTVTCSALPTLHAAAPSVSSAAHGCSSGLATMVEVASVAGAWRRAARAAANRVYKCSTGRANFTVNSRKRSRTTWHASSRKFTAAAASESNSRVHVCVRHALRHVRHAAM